MSFHHLRGHFKPRARQADEPNRSQIVRAILLEGASTAPEITSETGWDRRDTNWVLYGLRADGQIECVGRTPNDNNWPLKLWDLTAKGRRIARWRARMERASVKLPQAQTEKEL